MIDYHAHAHAHAHAYIEAEADDPDYWCVHGFDRDDVLHIRREANPTSEKIGQTTPDGQCIKNLRCIGGLTLNEFTTLSETEKEKIKKERPRWCSIEYYGIMGWVAGRNLREGSCPNNYIQPKMEKVNLGHRLQASPPLRQ